MVIGDYPTWINEVSPGIGTLITAIRTPVAPTSIRDATPFSLAPMRRSAISPTKGCPRMYDPYWSRTDP